MSTIIIKTNAGAAHDHAVRNATKPASPIAHFVCSESAPITDVLAIKALTAVAGESYRISEFPQTEVSETATRFQPEIPGHIANVQVNGIYVVLENGVVWGYAPYRAEHGGLTKTPDFSWTFDLISAESDSPTMEIRYEPFDLREIRQTLIDSLGIEQLRQQLAALTQKVKDCCDNAEGTFFTQENDDLIYHSDGKFQPLIGVAFEIQGDDLFAEGDSLPIFNINEEGELEIINNVEGTRFSISESGDLIYTTDGNYPPLQGVDFSLQANDLLAQTEIGDPLPELTINPIGELEVTE